MLFNGGDDFGACNAGGPPVTTGLRSNLEAAPRRGNRRTVLSRSGPTYFPAAGIFLRRIARALTEMPVLMIPDFTGSEWSMMIAFASTDRAFSCNAGIAWESVSTWYFPGFM
jgi:hypothetical protein